MATCTIGVGKTTGERTHYVIIADMKSRSITGLEEEIFNLGPAHRFMPQDSRRMRINSTPLIFSTMRLRIPVAGSQPAKIYRFCVASSFANASNSARPTPRPAR